MDGKLQAETRGDEAAVTGADKAAGAAEAVGAAEMGEERPAEPAFQDALFRQRRKHGKFRLVEPPQLESAAVDTHAHVHLLADPALSFAQCAVHGVGFVCDVVDICEDEPDVFERFDGWLAEAAALEPAILEASRDFVLAGGDDLTHLPAGAAPEDFLPACIRGVEGAAGVDGGPADGEDAALPPVPHLRLAVGCHPHNANRFDEAAEERLRARLCDPRVCAVGEIGLDYHYDFSPREVQREVFRRQIRIAHESGLPVALHIREAHDEAFQILCEEGFPEGGTLLHCFDLDWRTLEPWIDAGCYVALGGALTFARCEDTREAVTHVPLDRLLTETDSPYMTPEPMRGMPCGPSHVIFTAARMAEVLGCEPGPQRQALLDQLMGNARTLLDRSPTAWQCRRAGAPADLRPAAGEVLS